jgi:putative CRISPR-associated protein (TIGR02619 family)
MKIITTVGTSIFDKTPIKDYSEVKTLKNDANKKLIYAQKQQVEDEYNEILRKANAFCNSKSLSDLKEYSAECKTLHLIGQENITEIVLFTTDTVLGYLAGEILQTQLKRIFGNDKVKLERIEGLEVHNAATFQQTGFQNLVQKTSEEIRNGKAADKKVILNISGGYKAILPVMTLVGQLEEVPLNYVYEDSDKIIEIGNLPISFDWAVIEKYVVYLKNNSQLQKATNELKAEMKNLNLIDFDKENKALLTIMGTLLAEYLNRASPFTETIFGYLVEYKLDECYAKIYGREKVQHGVKFGNMAGTEDIDIYIKPTENEFITMEVKHAEFVLDSAEQMEKITKNLIYRAQETNKTEGEIAEIWLMLYSYTNTKKNTFMLSNEQNQTLAITANAIKHDAICENAVFKVKHFYIEANKLGSERHIYQTFMKSELKSEQIKDIYPNQ